MRSESLINGRWRIGSGADFSAIDPATGEIVWTGAEADAGDVADAFSAARAAFPDWSRRPREERAAIAKRFAELCREHADALAEAISRQTGKVLWDAKGEAAAVVGKIDISLRAQTERAGRREEPQPFGALTLDHRPHGVMAVFGPFNFPAHLPNGHIVPALLAGDTIVFKPSELAPGVGALMAELWEAAGLPEGVLNLVQGGRGVGQALLDGEGLAGVLFTGSVEAGRAIHRHFAGRPDVILALELGGNNPLIVWPPADLDAVANLVAHSAFVTSGQRCSCARRLILPRSSWGDHALAAIVALAGEIRVGAWNDEPQPFMGPLVREPAAARVEAFARDLIDAGGRGLMPLRRDGAFMWPTIIDMDGVSSAPDSEAFGPVLQVYRADSIEVAIALANATQFGLAGGLVGDDPMAFAAVEAGLRAGILNWNRPTTGASSAAPFGGPGLSGSGRPSAYYAADYVAYPVATQSAPTAAPIAAPGLPQKATT